MASNNMDHTDWQLNKTLFESNQYRLENEINCDVTFRVGQNQKVIIAHRFILSSRSPVFDRMLNGHFKETAEDPVIKDTDPRTFMAILRYCYYDCEVIPKEIAFTTLCAAQMYMLPLLEDKARDTVGKNLDAANVLQMYKYSTSTDDKGLLKHCQQFFELKLSNCLIWAVYEHALDFKDDHVKSTCRDYFQSTVSTVREALQDEAFLNIKHEVLLDFLHINDVFDKTEKLYAEMAKGEGPDRVNYKQHCGIYISEIELFKACNSWAEAECLRQKLEPTGVNKRTVLGDALFLIRFQTMLHKDLVCTVYPTGILTEEENSKILQYPSADVDDKPQICFPTGQRARLVCVKIQNNSVDIEPSERFLMTRIWFLDGGSYKINIRDNVLQKYHGMEVTPKSTHYLWKSTDGKKYILHHIDLDPVLLEAGGKYSLHIEAIIKDTNPSEPLKDSKYVDCRRYRVKEVKTTPELTNYGYALTMCLV